MSIVEDSEPKSFHILRLAQVTQVTGLCRSMIYQLEAQQRFPRRILLSTRAVGWLEGEVQEWIAMRVEGRRMVSRSY